MARGLQPSILVFISAWFLLRGREGALLSTFDPAHGCNDESCFIQPSKSYNRVESSQSLNGLASQVKRGQEHCWVDTRPDPVISCPPLSSARVMILPHDKQNAMDPISEYTKGKMTPEQGFSRPEKRLRLERDRHGAFKNDEIKNRAEMPPHRDGLKHNIDAGETNSEFSLNYQQINHSSDWLLIMDPTELELKKWLQNDMKTIDVPERYGQIDWYQKAIRNSYKLGEQIQLVGRSMRKLLNKPLLVVQLWARDSEQPFSVILPLDSGDVVPEREDLIDLFKKLHGSLSCVHNMVFDKLKTAISDKNLDFERMTLWLNQEVFHPQKSLPLVGKNDPQTCSIKKCSPVVNWILKFLRNKEPVSITSIAILGIWFKNTYPQWNEKVGSDDQFWKLAINLLLRDRRTENYEDETKGRRVEFLSANYNDDLQFSLPLKIEKYAEEMYSTFLKVLNEKKRYSSYQIYKVFPNEQVAIEKSKSKPNRFLITFLSPDGSTTPIEILLDIFGIFLLRISLCYQNFIPKTLFSNDEISQKLKQNFFSWLNKVLFSCTSSFPVLGPFEMNMDLNSHFGKFQKTHICMFEMFKNGDSKRVDKCCFDLLNHWFIIFKEQIQLQQYETKKMKKVLDELQYFSITNPNYFKEIEKKLEEKEIEEKHLCTIGNFRLYDMGEKIEHEFLNCGKYGISWLLFPKAFYENFHGRKRQIDARLLEILNFLLNNQKKINYPRRFYPWKNLRELGIIINRNLINSDEYLIQCIKNSSSTYTFKESHRKIRSFLSALTFHSRFLFQEMNTKELCKNSLVDEFYQWVSEVFLSVDAKFPIIGFVKTELLKDYGKDLPFNDAQKFVLIELKKSGFINYHITSLTLIGYWLKNCCEKIWCNYIKSDVGYSTYVMNIFKDSVKHID